MTDSTQTPAAPAHVGVVGGGRMGAGIAHAFLLARSRVTVVERDAEAADAASARIRESLRRTIERTPGVPALDDLVAALAVGTDVTAFGDIDLAIEAVPEDPELKRDALRRVEASVPATAVLASNTSSISIGELAADLARPARFVGLHFFNPVPASRLVEVVVGPRTDDAVVATARGWVAAIGKTAVVVNDAPGFASSRLGVALGLEAIRMVEEGVAAPADIDAAMELGYRHAMGPLRTTDIVGLDVRLGIAEELHAKLGDRFAPPELLRRMVAEGRLGRKSGRGFYDWDDAV